jgi:hypothetical protein
MAVSKLRITAKQLLSRVQEAARSSSNVVVIPPPDRRSMAGQMNWLQVLKCLREGSIVGKPSQNDNGDWVFQMQRCAANHVLVLDVIATVKGTRVDKIFVQLYSEI